MRIPEPERLAHAIRNLAATNEDLVRQQLLQPDKVALKALPDLILNLHADHRSESAGRSPAIPLWDPGTRSQEHCFSTL